MRCSLLAVALFVGCQGEPEGEVGPATAALIEEMSTVGGAPAGVEGLARATWRIEVDGEAPRTEVVLRGHAGVNERFERAAPHQPAVDPVSLGIVSEPVAGTPVRDVSLALSREIHARVVQRRVFERRSPADTWSVGEGDCTEIADLHAASLRGLGVPARVVAGAAATDGELRYHAWVEYEDGGSWIGVDPTWQVFPLHAGFVPLDAAPTAAELVGLEETIGRIRIRLED